MPVLEAGGVRLQYYLAGPDDGDPVLLHHGYASDYELNWVGSRWQDTLVRAERLVVGLDARGHGRSDKPHDPAYYGDLRMAADVIALLDHLGIARTDLIGYSMGARIGLRLAIEQGGRLGRAVLGGLGTAGGRAQAEAIASRMEGSSTGADDVAETFYRFARTRPHQDLLALAAVMRAQNPALEEADLGRVTTPLLFVTGSADVIAGGSAQLAARIPTATYVEIPGRDHTTAVPSRGFKDAALEFLDWSKPPAG